MSGKADSLKTIFYALGANFAIFVAKLVAAVITGSGAMTAEAVHSLADCGNQGLLLLGMKSAKAPPTPEHPLGHGKAVYFWSFLVALMLFSVGGAFSIYEGIHKLHEPQPLTRAWIAVAVLTFGIVAESFSMWGCLREVNKARGSRSLWRWFRESRQSELVVILGEDFAALLGLALALIAVLLTMLTGNPMWDGLGSMWIGVVLIAVAFGIGNEIMALLIGQSADPATVASLRRFVEAHEGVDEVYRVLTLQLGTSLMVSLKVKIKAKSAAELVSRINEVEAALRIEFPEIQWLFFEPDVAG